MRPGTTNHKLITAHGLVADSWLSVHPEISQPLSQSPTDRIRTLGITSNSTWNTWRSKRIEANSKRLDYIFINEQQVRAVESVVVFTELVPKLHCSYSDHFGVNTKIQLVDRPSPTEGLASGTAKTILTSDLFGEILDISQNYVAREVSQSRIRVRHFFMALFVFVGVLIGQWWVEPNYGHFILLLGTVLIMVYGTVDGLIGFLFGRWELRALKEFVSEMHLAQSIYTQGENEIEDVA